MHGVPTHLVVVAPRCGIRLLESGSRGTSQRVIVLRCPENPVCAAACDRPRSAVVGLCCSCPALLGLPVLRCASRRVLVWACCVGGWSFSTHAVYGLVVCGWCEIQRPEMLSGRRGRALLLACGPPRSPGAALRFAPGPRTGLLRRGLFVLPTVVLYACGGLCLA